MRRVLMSMVTLYAVAALATRLTEAAGLRRCHCSAACWCRRPGLSAFRWVLPIRHH